MTEIRHIVLDFGRVLLRWEPELPYRRLIPDEAARKHFLAEICNADWLTHTDRGMGWDEATAVLVARYPQHDRMIRAFRENWHEMVPAELPETVAVLDRLLAAGYDVTGLTNFSADTLDEARLRFPFLARLRGATVSARVGLLKPELPMYQRHAADFGLDPAATLFFDDVLANVEGARNAGWNAEQFTDAERMRDDLARYGVRLGA